MEWSGSVQIETDPNTNPVAQKLTDPTDPDPNPDPHTGVKDTGYPSVFFISLSVFPLPDIPMIGPPIFLQQNRQTDPGNIYVNRSQLHECRSWERGRSVSFLGIFVSNFPYSVFAVWAVFNDDLCLWNYLVSLGVSVSVSVSRISLHSLNQDEQKNLDISKRNKHMFP